jgi:hypothetical protein
MLAAPTLGTVAAKALMITVFWPGVGLKWLHGVTAGEPVQDAMVIRAVLRVLGQELLKPAGRRGEVSTAVVELCPVPVDRPQEFRIPGLDRSESASGRA